MDLSQLKTFLDSQNLPPFRFRQIVKNYFSGRYSSFDQMTDLSKDLRAKLSENFSLLSVSETKTVGDNSVQKSLLKLSDGQSIETVLMDAEIDEYLPPIKECGRNGYGLIVTGISMSPKFEPEDRIYVNPDFQVIDLKTGDLVIVSCAGDNEATFKQLIIEGTTKYLKPLNPKWDEQIIKLTEDCRLVGKVVGLYRKI